MNWSFKHKTESINQSGNLSSNCSANYPLNNLVLINLLHRHTFQICGFRYHVSSTLTKTRNILELYRPTVEKSKQCILHCNRIRTWQSSAKKPGNILTIFTLPPLEEVVHDLVDFCSIILHHTNTRKEPYVKNFMSQVFPPDECRRLVGQKSRIGGLFLLEK